MLSKCDVDQLCEGHPHSLCVSLGEVVTCLPACLPEPPQQLLDLVAVRTRWAGQEARLWGLTGAQGTRMQATDVQGTWMQDEVVQ